MRSAIIAAAFAVSAIAVPHQKRDVVTATDVEMVYVTDIVTVTDSGTAAAPTTAPTTQGKQYGTHYGHKKPDWWHSRHTSQVQTSAAPSPTTTATTEAPAPTTQAPAPTTQAPAPTTAAPTSAPAAPTGSAGTDYSSRVIFHHNLHRSNHSAPPIEWDDGLAKSAADIAATCIYAHNTDMDGGGYGQNIAAGVGPDNITAVITDLFYNGEVNWYNGLYGEANPDMTNFESWGHFSQIVWKDTTHVACATQDCTSQGLANTGGDVSPFFTVCNYKSPGNFGGEYGDNVLEPLGDPTAQWNTGL